MRKYYDKDIAFQYSHCSVTQIYPHDPNICVLLTISHKKSSQKAGVQNICTQKIPYNRCTGLKANNLVLPARKPFLN